MTHDASRYGETDKSAVTHQEAALLRRHDAFDQHEQRMRDNVARQRAAEVAAKQWGEW